MRDAQWPAIVLFISCSVLSSCDCGQSEKTPAVGWNQDAGRLESQDVDVDEVAALYRGELNAAESAQLDKLRVILRKFYPRWDRDAESLAEYLDRYETSPETLRLTSLVDSRLKDKTDWLAFLSDVRAALPDARVKNGTPPFFTIPSHQIVIITNHPRGSIGIVFRLSFLAPYYDYYENIRDKRNRLLTTSLEPSPRSQAVAALVRNKIAEHFGAYQELPAKIGAALLNDMKAGNLTPDETTVADAMFEANRSW